MSDEKPIGRPSKFDPEYVEQAYKLALLGATDKQMADFWGISEKTLNNWKEAHSDFLQSLKAGKLSADSTISEALFHRARGYSNPNAVKIFMPAGTKEPVYAPFTEHHPPDTTAAIFWLKNRQPAVWRDKTENMTRLVDENDRPLSLPDLARELAFLLASGVQAIEADDPSLH